MAVVEHAARPVVQDPSPTVASDDSIREAQALREALRRRFLDRPAPQVDPYWAVGAD
jgi:hypothetical protein